MAYLLSAGQPITARPGGTNGLTWLAPAFVLHVQTMQIGLFLSSTLHVCQAQSARAHLCMKPPQACLSLSQTNPLPFGSARDRMPKPLAQRPSQQGPAYMLVSVGTTTSRVLRKQTSPHTVQTRPAHLLNGHSHPITLPPTTPRFFTPLTSNRPNHACMTSPASSLTPTTALTVTMPPSYNIAEASSHASPKRSSYCPFAPQNPHKPGTYSYVQHAQMPAVAHVERWPVDSHKKLQRSK